jgi:hypothetical protein
MPTRYVCNAVGIAPECEALDPHDATGQAGQDWLQSSVPRSLCHISIGRSRGAASAVPYDPGADTAIRDPPTEGCADMTECRRRQANESGRDRAIGIADRATNRLSEHREWRFSANPRSFAGPQSILHLNALERGGIFMEWKSGDAAERRPYGISRVLEIMSDASPAILQVLSEPLNRTAVL